MEWVRLDDWDATGEWGVSGALSSAATSMDPKLFMYQIVPARTEAIRKRENRLKKRKENP